jgi:Barrel-sandwich domain of CusB or HlyD membrane-fusion
VRLVAEQTASDVKRLATLLRLARRARHAGDLNELAFTLVNESFQLAEYRQSALWLRQGGIRALSGVSAPEQNAPFVHWLSGLVASMSSVSSNDEMTRIITAGDVPQDLRGSWAEWLPAEVLWVPLSNTQTGVLLMARDAHWQPDEIALLSEWTDMWAHEWRARVNAQLRRGLFGGWAGLKNLRNARWIRYALPAVVILCIPVRLTVLAPGELVPARPSVIRAPFDGVVGQVLVQPNQRVSENQPLFTLDQSTLQARLGVAQQALITAEAAYRQQAQIAVFDAKGKARLAELQGAIAERQAEASYLKQQLERSTITASRDGIVMFDDPSQLTGRPVVTGERIATVADEHDVEVEAWLAPGDLIELPSRPHVTLYLNTSPLSPVSATLRYVLYEATESPDGSFAYRMRATVNKDQALHRVGLRGTAKVSGKHVPLVYWLLRRPLATARELIGL